MRRTALLLGLVVLAGGAAIWWTSRPKPVRPVADPADSSPSSGTLEGAGPMTAAPGAGSRTPVRSTPTKPAPTPAPISRATGSLRVRFTGDRTPESGQVRIDLEAIRPTPEPARIPVPEDGGSWVYETLPVGRYRVIGNVIGYATTAQEAAVEEAKETVVELRLEPGAEVAWRVTIPGDDAPKAVKVHLLDPRGNRVPAAYQTDATLLWLSPDRAVAVPLEGRLVGLKPGRYRVRAESPAGETDEQDVVAELGARAQVDLRLRR